MAPYSAVASGWVGHLLDLTGRPSEGFAEVSRALEIDSTNPPVLVFAAQAQMAMGNREAGMRHMERLWQTVPQWRVPAAMMLAELGDTTRVRELLGTATDVPLAQPNTPAAFLHLAAGDTTRYFEAIERATASGEMWPTFYSMSERMFDQVRGSARFAAVIRAVGLDEATFTSPNGGRPR